MIDAGASRAAVIAWRDDATLSAMTLVHEAAAAAMGVLEGRLNTIANAEAMTNADAAARTIVRPAMREVVGAAADRWFTMQARALREVDARVELLALRFAAMSERPMLPQEGAPPPADWRVPEWLRSSFEAIGETLDRGSDVAARAVPDLVRHGAEQATARIGREIGERSGAHDRVRAAGRGELTRVWLGPLLAEDGARPYLTQLLDTIDETARAARETLA